jgi:predicted RNA-binding Zn-ribbon protein involved in translation (DUF1610 family)
MTSTHYCESCNIEFRIQHDANKELFVVSICPFCGDELDPEEHYDFDDEEDE